jgi:uncharacterized hydrophobic protein (TIGR00271 family)
LASEGEELEFVCLELGVEGGNEKAVRAALGEDLPDHHTVTVVRHPMVVRAVLDRVQKADPDLLVTGHFVLPKVGGKDQDSDSLVRSSPCTTFSLLFGEKGPSEIKRVLFVVTGGAHDREGIRLVDRLRRRKDVQVTIGTIEPETGATAGRLGEQTIQTLTHDVALEDESFDTKVVVDRLPHRGILKLFEDHDLVVVGTDATGFLRPLRQSVGEATAAAVKRIPPLRMRSLPEWLPRINPSDHADLLFDLRQGSIWGPDFVLMLGLAAAIASLGLLQNSPAVVIGSMLLAPLMTPLMGLGLAMGQANRELSGLCAGAVGRGFLLVLGVSLLIGFVTPTGETLTQEVLARGSPNILDLLIAVFAAMAAAYAMARPNLVGSIAGVAIATALVPPGCAIGISLAQGDVLNALGAGLLLLTNFAAIIVASNITFMAMGVTGSRALGRDRRLAFMVRGGLLLLLAILMGPLSIGLISQIEEGKSVSAAYPVTRAVSRRLQDRVGLDEGVEIMLMARPRAEEGVVIHLASKEELPPSYASELRQIVREEMSDSGLPVTVIAVRGLWMSDSDAPEGG